MEPTSPNVIGAKDLELVCTRALASPRRHLLRREKRRYLMTQIEGRLIEGADLNLKDEKYKSPPLGWAIHGWYDPPAGNHGRQCEVVVLLVSAGARVEPEWLESERVRTNPAMLAALRAGTL